MNRDDKIVRKMKQSPKSIRFDELEAFLVRQGFGGTQRGSHVQFRREDGTRFSIVKPHGGKNTVHRNAIKEVLDKLDL